MHPAWHIPEIQALILDHLETADLITLAQTSQGTFALATDRIWNSINSVTPFLLHFTTKLWRPGHSWERILMYMAKVERITWERPHSKQTILLSLPWSRERDSSNGMKWIPLYRESWREVHRQALASGRDVFPNLKQIRMHRIAEPVLWVLVGMSGRRLQRLSIEKVAERQDPSTVKLLLDGLRDTPCLEYLFIKDGEIDLLPNSLIENSPKLKHLRLDPRMPWASEAKELPLSTAIVEQKSLEHLTISLNKNSWTPELASAIEHKFLPNLKSLCLFLTNYREKDSPDSPLKGKLPALFISGLAQPSLEELTIMLRDDEEVCDLSLLLSAFNKSCQTSKLHILSLIRRTEHPYNTRFERPEPPPPKTAALKASLLSLLPLGRLTSLTIEIVPDFLDALDLPLFEQLAHGMPALTTLTLSNTDYYYGLHWRQVQTSGDATELAHVAAFCHFFATLTTVRVAIIDARQLELRPNRAWVCPSVTLLQISVLWTGGSSQTGVDTARLTNSLRSYFPNSDFARHMNVEEASQL